MIYITGDMHGDINRFESYPIKKLKKNDTLIVCGDFGFIWNDSKEEKNILNKLSKKKYNILFVDGKHENYDLLSKYEVIKWNGGKVQNICGNVYHLMRGQVFEIEGKKIFTFGGGESLEKEMRIQLGTWWEEELPKISEMREGVDELININKDVDYIITHEPPFHIKSLIDRRSSINRLQAFFDELSKEVNYEKWFFGSLHLDKDISKKYQAVFLDMIDLNKDKRLGVKK